MKEEKIRIDNSADLYKLSINTIKNTKLYNFEGKYFDKIYEEALKIERSGGNIDEVFKPKIKIYFVEFEILFNTEFGKKLVICGSGEQLGNWDVTKALSLTWSCGNIWRARINVTDNFEFKLVFMENCEVKKWETGENRIFNLKEITSSLSSAEILNNNTITIDDKFPESYIYDHTNSVIKIIFKFKN